MYIWKAVSLCLFCILSCLMCCFYSEFVCLLRRNKYDDDDDDALQIIREPKGPACPNSEWRFPAFDATISIPVSRTKGQRSKVKVTRPISADTHREPYLPNGKAYELLIMAVNVRECFANCTWNLNASFGSYTRWPKKWFHFILLLYNSRSISNFWQWTRKNNQGNEFHRLVMENGNSPILLKPSHGK